MVKENLAGKRFGKLTVVSPAPNKGNKTCWNCLCEYGNYTIYNSAQEAVLMNNLSNISACCRGKYKTTGEYIWRYEK